MSELRKEVNCAVCPFACLKGLISDLEHGKLSENRSEILYDRDEAILKQGSFVDQVLYVKTGLVKIISQARNGRTTIIRIIGDNQFMGLPLALKNSKYPFSAVALRDTEICQIRKDTFKEVYEQNPKATDYFSVDMANEYWHLYERIALLTTRNNYGKLAGAMLELASESFNGRNLLESLSRKELADYAAISLESANKILLELKNDRILAIENKRIRILQPELVQRLSTIG